MELAEKVKLRRAELGLSQDDLARKMGYKSRSSIHKIETGRPVTQKIIVRLADALDVSVPYLMGWVDVEEQKKNDIAVDIAVRLRKDDDFLSIVSLLNEFDAEKLQKVKQIIQLL